MRSSSRGKHSGFTLLEVLAAIALLGVVFTALSRAASVGVLSEGHSRRLLEASLLADAELAQLELDTLAGALPEPGLEEKELDDYEVTIETLPWPLPEPLRLARDELTTVESPVFGDGSDQAQGAMREIHITISWSDGVRDRSLERVTYALDPAAVDGLEGLGPIGLVDPSSLPEGAPDGTPDE